MLSVILHILVVSEISGSKWEEDSKIVGGRPLLDAESIPFIVSVQLADEGHNCGGSLLSPLYVLTACHCLADIESDLEVVQPFPVNAYVFVAGLVKLSKTLHSQTRVAKKFHIHPGCGRSALSVMIHDLSIGEMNQPFAITEYVQPFKLLSEDPENFSRRMNSLLGDPDSVCLVAGWGVTERGVVQKAVASNVLNAVRMFVIPESKCQQIYGTRNQKYADFPFSKYHQFCTISRRFDASDCQGDSGGPYFCGDYVVGVVSYGFECGTPMPNVYTSLADFLKWFTTEVRRTSHKEMDDVHTSSSDNTFIEVTSERDQEETVVSIVPRKVHDNHSWKPRLSLILCTVLAVSYLIHFPE